MQPTKTSAGNETPQETVARAKALLAKEGNTGYATSSQSSTQRTNPLIDVITQRLTEQSSGISTSASSNLQASINEAISGVQRSGELSSAALESQRRREVGYAADRASATFSGALERRSGYATQVVALKELTETTEKSVRDLDMRYKEAIMANDANTASEIAGLQMQKLQFQQQAEQNFYQNLFAAANLTQQDLQMQQQSEQFWSDQNRQADQFARQMAQSDYQFEKNLGIQYQELGFKQQELDIARERNQISWAEYNLQSQKINKDKNFTTTQGLINQRMIQMAQSGVLDGVDPLTIAGQLRAEMEGQGFTFDGTTEDFSTIVMQSYLDVKSSGIAAATNDTQTPVTYGGLLGEGSAGGSFFGSVAGGVPVAGQFLSESIWGTPAGQTPLASQMDWGQFGRSVAGYGYQVNPYTSVPYNMYQNFK